MLIKEYRIPMPLTVKEYRIAQLYMIQKKSREESQGTESGVEIIKNEPYTDGPGGNGQYTQKVYHIAKHIPGWLVPILPKDALVVEEEAWNAYPYTRTRYTCPFIEKFSIDIETRYFNDAGEQDNVFNCSTSELRSRIVDDIDIVTEQVSDYNKEEDPKCFHSTKTSRGPLEDGWLKTIRKQPVENRTSVMCSYKRCKVEFKYWGMQTKIEKFIHDIGLRKTMLRAHKQAWCWQDEWYGLTIADIRQLEKETQLALQLKFGKNSSEDEGVSQKNESNNTSGEGESQASVRGRSSFLRKNSNSSMVSTRSKLSHTADPRFPIQIEGIRRYSEDSSSDDEFFDAQDDFIEAENDFSQLKKTNWNGSLDGLDDLEHNIDDQAKFNDHQINSNSVPQSESSKIDVLFMVLHGGNSQESSMHGSHTSKQSDLQTLQATFESVMCLHYKSSMDRVAFRLVACPTICNEAYQLLQNISPMGHDFQNEQSLSSSMVSLFATNSTSYSNAVTALFRTCNLAFHTFLLSTEGHGFNGQVCFIGDTIGSVLGYDMLCKLNRRSNSMANPEGSLEEEDAPSSPFLGVVTPPSPRNRSPAPRRRSASPSLGGISRDAAFSLVQNTNFLFPDPNQSHRANEGPLDIQRSSSFSGVNSDHEGPIRQSSQGTQPPDTLKLDFEVAEFFMLGSPLGVILTMRQLLNGNDMIMTPQKISVTSQLTPPRPACHHIYNLFYTSDPSSARIEPLLDIRFATFPPSSVSKYQVFPLGNGQSISIGDLLSSCDNLFMNANLERRESEWSIESGSLSQISNMAKKRLCNVQSTGSLGECNDDLSKFSSVRAVNVQVANRWWGEKRLDYALFAPDALSNFPSSSLPHLFHASFWESFDLAAFILQQVVKHEHTHVSLDGEKSKLSFTSEFPREKWIRKRTMVKIRNVTPNHRSKDAVVLENGVQTLSGRFMYGPLDMVTLTGEKVDVHVLTSPPKSEWVHLGSEVTNSHGRITFTIPDDKRLLQGIYPVKMVVRGDHTFADSFLAVLPPQTGCVVFSIDGSFTASVSIMGSDPKVRPGAIDVVRMWQDLGYMIIYITGRPDMQKQKVVKWLAQHNFPHGLIWFGDGLNHDPLKQKMLLLRTIKNDNKLNFAAGYGSAKDIAVYSQLDLAPNRIFIIGKLSKKQLQQCNGIQDGYSVHLNELMSEGIPPAKYNSQILLRKGCFGLPGQSVSKKRSRSISKRKSYIGL